MTRIFVRNLDLGFFTQVPITAQKFEKIDDELELSWCNHAGAVEETVQNEVPRIDEPDICWESRIMVCDRVNCQAYRIEGDDFWEDAPCEGISYEGDRFNG